jgi:competence protein ComEC
MNFLQRTPFFRLFTALAAGIIFFQFVELNVMLLVICFTASILLMFGSYFIRNKSYFYRFRWLFGAGVFIFLFSLGYSLSFLRDKNSSFSCLDKKGIYLVELSCAPVEKAKSYKCEVDVRGEYVDDKWNVGNGKAIIYLQKDTLSANLLYGDKLLVQTTFREPQGAVNPDGFNYAKYLERKGIRATAYLYSGSWKLAEHSTDFSIFRLADQSRKKLLDIYKHFGISGDEYAVLAALTLGFTDDLQPDLLKGYSATGAMHILSVSGLHVGIVYVVIAFLLGLVFKGDKRKVIRTIIAILFLWSYAFLTGLSPSVIRSALMFSLVAVGTALDRKSQIYNTVFMSAFIMLLVNPDYLFDVGFQLSYLAVLSIVFFQRPISNLFPVKNRPLRWLRDLLAVSVAAQLGTLPVTLYYFQQFPNYFLLTNIVAIPLSTIVIYLALLLLAVNFIPVVSVAIAFVLKWSVWLLNFLIIGIQNLPFSVSSISLDLTQMFFVFLALATIATYFYTKKFWSLAVGLSSVLLVLLISFAVKWDTLHSKQLIVYSSSKSLHISMIERGKNYVITNDSDDLEKIATAFWRKHFIDRPNLISKDGVFGNIVEFEGKRILIADVYWWKNILVEGNIPVDYLIIGNRAKPKMKYLLQNVSPGKVIVDSSISDWYTESVREACAERNIPFYSIAERGAYILNFTN